MLVHRDNDEKSGGDAAHKDGKGIKPHLIADNSPLPDGTQPVPDAADGTGSSQTGASGSSTDDGKTLMIGDALKSVYQRTLEEDIPDDFLDLLKQLK